MSGADREPVFTIDDQGLLLRDYVSLAGDFRVSYLRVGATAVGWRTRPGNLGVSRVPEAVCLPRRRLPLTVDVRLVAEALARQVDHQ
jgi:hypothetical protein